MRRFTAIFTMVLMAVMLLIGVAFANEPTPLGGAISNLLTETVIPLVGTAVLAMVGILLEFLRRKFKIQGMKEEEEWLREKGADAIGYAEEWAARKVEDNVGHLATKNDVINTAITKLVENAPKVDRQKGADIINSLYGRISGVGATGDKAVSIK